MGQRLALIHTSPVLVPLFDALCLAKLADIERFHVVDESLIRNTIKSGYLERITTRRLVGHVTSAFDAGATAVLVTCSSIGPGVAVARQLFDQPVFRIDEAMAAKAVSIGNRVGVLATLQTTLRPTTQLVRETAACAGTPCEVVEGLCEGAFEKMVAGDGTAHDRLVKEALIRLASKVDVVVLAQASMARVLREVPPDDLPVPVLCSPELAMDQIRLALCGNTADRLADVSA